MKTMRPIPRAAAAAAAALIAAAAAMPSFPAQAAWRGAPPLVTVANVAVASFAGGVKVAISASHPVRHRVVDWAGKPDTKIIVDLIGATLGFPAGTLPYRKGDITQIRVGQFNKTTVRVVVELTAKRSYTVQADPDDRAVTIRISGPSAVSPGAPAGAQASPLATQARTATRPAPPPRTAAPGTGRFTLEFRDAKMSDVMAALARLANLNIVVTPEAGERRVTVRLVNVTLNEALELLTRPFGLGWVRIGANIVVGPADKIVEQQVEIRYYSLRYARAADAAPRIEALIFGRVRPAPAQEEAAREGQARGPAPPRPVERTPIVVDERTNTLIVVATREQHAMVEGILRRIDVPIPVAAMVTRVYPLRWLNVDPSAAERPGAARDVGADLVALLAAHLRPSTPTITFDYRNNALIVTGIEGDHDRIAALLARIDVPARQVLVEATVVEITLDVIRALGLEWGPVRIGTAPGVPGAAPGVAWNPITGAVAFLAQLHAVVTDGRGRLMANPRVVTKDGQPAQIFLGDRIPVTVGVREGVPVVEFLEAGVTLDITPKVNPDGFVTTRILADVGAVRAVPGVGAAALTRRALTTLTVQDGQPIVIGGLIRNEERTATVRIPLLGDIPIIGFLFRWETTTRVDSEVVFVITPRVLPKLDEPRL
jgi:type II secretory pathway component GspD/PulD (secretin)